MVESTEPVLVRDVKRGVSYALEPRDSGPDLLARLERLETTCTTEALEHTVRTAVWRYDPLADSFDWLNFALATVLLPFDAFGMFECGVTGTRHPFALWETAWVSSIPFLTVKRSPGGWSPFIGSTPTIETRKVREGEQQTTLVERFPLVDRRVELLIGGAVLCAARTAIDGEARFSVARLRDLPWENGPAELVSGEGARASLPRAFEDGLRRARGEDLNGRALVAESEGRLELARDAARRARTLGHQGAPALERRLDLAIALDRTRALVTAGDLEGAARNLASLPDPAARELAQALATRIERRALLRARGHLLAGRPARALTLALPIASDEGCEIVAAARASWAKRCSGEITGASSKGERLLLSGAALALGGTRGERGAFAIELARAIAPGEPDPERFAAASREAERFERAVQGAVLTEALAATLRREAAASVRSLARAGNLADPGLESELERASPGAALTIEPALPDCRACNGGGVSPGDVLLGQLTPCRRCGGSGLAR